MSFQTKFCRNISNIIIFRLLSDSLICMISIRQEILIISNVFSIPVLSKDKNNYYRILNEREVFRRNKCYWRGKQRKWIHLINGKLKQI